MSRETPIDQINNNLSKEEDDIVNSILSEINQESEQKENIQQTPQQMQQQMPQQIPQQMQQQMQQQMPQQMPQQMQQQMQQQMPENMEIDHKLIMNENKSFFSSLDINIKGALFVALCAFVVLLPQVNNMILSSGISQFIGEDGNITMIGTSFKCLVVGILYYIFKTYYN